MDVLFACSHSSFWLAHDRLAHRSASPLLSIVSRLSSETSIEVQRQEGGRWKAARIDMLHADQPFKAFIMRRNAMRGNAICNASLFLKLYNSRHISLQDIKREKLKRSTSTPRDLPVCDFSTYTPFPITKRRHFTHCNLVHFAFFRTLYANLVLVALGLPGGLTNRPSVVTAMPGKLPKVVCCGGGLAGW